MAESFLGNVVSCAVLGTGLFIGWNYLLDEQPTMCEARMKFIADQAPFALEIEAARHPLSIGLVRSWLNQDGSLDTAIRGLLMTNSASSDLPIKCAMQTAWMHVAPDQIRRALADEMENTFQLAGYP